MDNNSRFLASVHLFIIKNGQILLLKRANTGYQDGNWSVVAGRMDGNEEVKSAAIREAKEEAGITISPFDIEVIGVMHRKSGNEDWIDFFLNVKKWSGDIINAEPHKCEELTWVDVRKLPENMIPYIRTAIEKNNNQLWFESCGW
jgi:8-oxo-dGTP diphosphatase